MMLTNVNIFFFYFSYLSNEFGINNNFNFTLSINYDSSFKRHCSRYFLFDPKTFLVDHFSRELLRQELMKL